MITQSQVGVQGQIGGGANPQRALEGGTDDFSVRRRARKPGTAGLIYSLQYGKAEQRHDPWAWYEVACGTVKGGARVDTAKSGAGKQVLVQWEGDTRMGTGA